MVLGSGAWFAWPRAEKLTAAQRWAHDHAGETSASLSRRQRRSRP